MSAALSNLTGVVELGLSIDSGLGWLNGPDISDRARTLREKPRIFGKSQRLPDTSTQQRQTEWLQEANSILGSSQEPGLPVRNGFYKATVYWPPAVSCGTSRGPLFDCIPESSIAPESLSRSSYLRWGQHSTAKSHGGRGTLQRHKTHGILEGAAHSQFSLVFLNRSGF